MSLTHSFLAVNIMKLQLKDDSPIKSDVYFISKLWGKSVNSQNVSWIEDERVYSACRAEYPKGTSHFFSLLHLKRTSKEPVTRSGCFLHNYTEKKRKKMLLCTSFRHMPQYTIEKLDH